MKFTIIGGFFLPIPPVRGGATERNWFEMGRRLAIRGHSVDFVAHGIPGSRLARAPDGCTLTLLKGYTHGRSRWRNVILDYLWSCRTAHAASRSDWIIATPALFPIAPAIFRRRKGRVAWVLGRMPRGRGRWVKRIDLVLCLSRAVRERLISENPEAAEQSRVFPYSIDATLFADSGAAKPLPPPVVIGYAGRIHPEKGLDLLIKAARVLRDRPDLPEWEIRIIGPQSVADGGGGPEYLADLRDAGQKLIAEQRLKIHEPLFRPGDLASEVGSWHLFVYPSVAEEGETFGVAPLEGMAAGAAPVVSKLHCFREFLRPDENGIVFDHRSTSADRQLAEILERLIRQTDERTRLAAQARQDAAKFDHEAGVDRLLEILDDL